MSTPTNKTVNIYINQASAEKALENLNKRADKLNQTIEKGRKSGKDMTTELAKLDETKRKADELSGIISGKMAPSLKMVQAEASRLRRELRGMSQDAPGYAAKFREFEKVNGTLVQMNGNLNKVGRTMASQSKSSGFMASIKGIAAGTLIGNAVQSGVMALGSYITGMVSGNAKLSDSLADVRKATGLSADEVRRLNSELKKIDTRTKAAELREIAVGLGQIGEAATAENVANIDKIVVALGDEFGGGAREITTVLGILRNNLKDIQTGNYGEDVLHIGNALNVLGAEGLATAPIVTDFANRMAGIGGTFGVTSGQILGLAAAMQELGIAPERGATAFNKLLQKMTADVDKFGKIAQHTGISAKEFAALVNSDIVAALQKVAEGSKIAGSNNRDFGMILKELDADGAGAGEVLSKLAANSELVSVKVGRATEALKESSSILEEFTTKNTNLAATLDKVGKWFASKIFSSTIADGLNSFVTGFGKLVGAIDATTLSLQELDQEAKVIADLEEKVSPLISDYEALARKAKALGGESKLSKDEQLNLKKALEGIAEAIPLTVTKVDEYGRALQVNTKYAKDFIKYQKEALAVKNAAMIRSLTDDVQDQVVQVVGAQNMHQSFIERAKKDMDENGGALSDYYNKAVASTKEKYESSLNTLRGQVALLAETTGKSIEETLNNLPAPKESWFNKTFGYFKGGAKRFTTRAIDLLGDDFSKPTESAGTGDTGSTGGGGTGGTVLSDEAQRLEDHRKEVLRQIASLKAEVAAMAADESSTFKLNHEKQIADVKDKYKKLLDEAIKYGVNIAQINELQAKELDTLLKKQMDERSNKEYELSLQNLDDFYNKERQKAAEKYTAGTIDYRRYQEQLIAIDRNQAQDRVTIATDYAQSAVKAAQDLERAKTEATRRGVMERRRIEEQAAQDQVYAAERAVLTSRIGTEQQLDAKINLIKLTFDREIELAKDSKEKQLLLEAEKNQAITAARQEHVRYWIDITSQAVNSLQSVFTSYFNFLNQKDQAALAKDRAANDQKKKNLEKQLEAKHISQSEYNRKIQELDDAYAKKELEVKRKQFNREKAQAVAEAAINAATAITKIWAVHGAWPPQAVILASIVGATTAAQIGMIAASKFPEYRKGGQLPEGPSHEQGGIALVSGGQKIGEIEGGEPILSRETYRNNKPLVDALLRASMYGGGRSIGADWMHSMPAGINMSGFARISPRQFENGGTLPTGSGTAGSSSMGFDKETVEALKAFTEALKNPLRANIVFQELRDKQKTYEDIKKAGSLKR